MHNSNNTIITAFLFLIILSCNAPADSEKFSLHVDNAVKEQMFKIKLKKNFNFQGMRVISNTLNDTCMIGLMKVPPGKTGRLYSMEFMSDSLSYKYFPYKANAGNLTFEHSFFDQ